MRIYDLAKEIGQKLSIDIKPAKLAEEFKTLPQFAEITQLQLTLRMGRTYLYLGYQVDNCRKMNYKSSYLPHERLKNKVWEKYTITGD